MHTVFISFGDRLNRRPDNCAINLTPVNQVNRLTVISLATVEKLGMSS